MNKTVIIASNAYSPNIGGVENSLRYLAQSYQKLGFKAIIVVSDVAETGVKLPFYEIVNDTPIYRYPAFSESNIKIPGVRAITSGFYAWKLFRKLNLSEDIQLTVSRFHTTTVIAKLSGLPNINYLVPGVVKYQNSVKNLVSKSGFAHIKQKISKYAHHVIQKSAFNLSDRVLVFSRNMLEQVVSVTTKATNIPILKPGVDTYRFKPTVDKTRLREKYNIPHNKRVLITVGRFVNAKGFNYVIKAMKQLPDWHLIMVGDGESWQKSKQLISSLGINNQVTLVGSQPDTAPFYQLSDAFVMSSIYEPLGQTILEALSSGLPVIAFKGKTITTATDELLEESEAIFTDDISPKGLVKAISKLINTPNLIEELSLRSRQLAKAKFSWDKLAINILNKPND